MNKTLIIAACAIAVSACAKNPEDVVAADLGPNAFLNFSCSNLAKQELTVKQNIENLSAAQRSARSNDTLGVILIGVPVSSMSGNDQEAQLSVAKGQLQAISQAKVQKNCR